MTGITLLAGASYFYFFVAVMAVTAVLFTLVAGFYRGKIHIQDEVEAHPG